MAIVLNYVILCMYYTYKGRVGFCAIRISHLIYCNLQTCLRKSGNRTKLPSSTTCRGVFVLNRVDATVAEGWVWVWTDLGFKKVIFPVIYF